MIGCVLPVDAVVFRRNVTISCCNHLISIAGGTEQRGSIVGCRVLCCSFVPVLSVPVGLSFAGIESRRLHRVR